MVESDIPRTQDIISEKLPTLDDSASSGHGTGLRWQSLLKSSAYFDGSTSMFAWMYPLATPVVGTVSVLARASARASCPVQVASRSMSEY